jgi:hypothetical protein
VPDPEFSREGIGTLGELKAFLAQLPLPDDAPVWSGDTVTQGGLGYPSGYRHYDVNVLVTPETFGLALPAARQRTEEGVVFW